MVSGHPFVAFLHQSTFLIQYINRRFFYVAPKQQCFFVAPSISSLKLSRHPPLKNHNLWTMSRVKEFIIASQQLEVLVLDFPSHFHRDSTGSLTEKLPPLKKLKLSHYQFDSTTPENWKIWDFSRLERLELITTSYRLGSFLNLVAAKDFPNITGLKFANEDNYEKFQLLNHPEILTSFVSRLGSLTYLSLDTFNPKTIIPAVLKIGTSLRDLDLRHINSYSCIKSVELKKIQQSCPNIRVLEIRIESFDVS